MTIAVAVSGGLDSLLALRLLQRQGREVLALHARLLEPSPRDQEVAKRLAAACRDLDIPLIAVDLVAPFRRLVIKPFVASYLAGETPNPCALCNLRIKFGLLLEEALAAGAEQLATGHYARSGRDSAGRPGLWRGVDPDKEQSYFLALLGFEQLERVCFPLGLWRKREAGEALKELGPVVPASRESQEICFIREGDYRTFLESQNVELPGPGPILDTRGRELGRHRGLHRYTLGQRRGLGIAHTEPLYVLAKEPGRNALLVGPREELAARGFTVREVSELLPLSAWPEPVWVQTTFRQRPKAARAAADQGGGLWVELLEAQEPATPGQVAAFYDCDGRVLGGGIVREPFGCPGRPGRLLAPSPDQSPGPA